MKTCAKNLKCPPQICYASGQEADEDEDEEDASNNSSLRSPRRCLLHTTARIDRANTLLIQQNKLISSSNIDPAYSDQVDNYARASSPAVSSCMTKGYRIKTRLYYCNEIFFYEKW